MPGVLYSHAALTAAPHRLTHNAQEYLIAPCSMIVEGVLNGGLVTAEAIQACQWNGIPVVVNHPQDAASGQATSANDPLILSQYGIGQVFRTQYANASVRGASRLRAQAELWIAVERPAQLGGEAQQCLTMLEAQTPLEVSTAFFSDTEQAIGSFYGVPYVEIHHNLRADHLALLPNAVGACNWQDGCGAPRVNQAHCGCAACQERTTMPQEPQTGWRRFVAVLRDFVRQAETDLSVNQTDVDLRETITAALAREHHEAREHGEYYDYVYIDSVDAAAQTFTYRCGDELKQRGWTMGAAGVLTLDTEERDVQRVTTYVPVGPIETVEGDPPGEGGMLMDNQSKESPMPATAVIKRRVDALIANTDTRWTEGDRHLLEEQNEAFLIRLESQPREVKTMAARLPETVDEAIATLPAHLQEPLAAMAQEYETRKNAAVSLLVANKSCPFSTEELQAMTAQRLEQLVTMAGIVQAPRKAEANYIGMGMPHVREVPEEERPPAPPNTLKLVVERQRSLGKLAG